MRKIVRWARVDFQHAAVLVASMTAFHSRDAADFCARSRVATHAGES